MSFVLRQIAQRAGGGEIVRTRELTAAEPVIGRGADADIQLGDLAVSLRHARLRMTGPGRVEVEALGPTGFELDGEEVARAELKPADGPVVGFGSYRLALSAQGDDVVVTVSRDET
ncbi:MAG TPA: FHA domain-containing protein, partial [Caulobacteraceae bacterium]|nr:FHA domain-containing protein [Caulobacteraceae bacterium]